MGSFLVSGWRVSTCCAVGLLVSCTVLLHTSALSQSSAVLTPRSTIGLALDDLILGAYGIAFFPDARMLVADKLEYTLKCFGSDRHLAFSVGKKGTGDGEFRGPGPIAISDTLVAVADFASTRVQVFSSSLRPRFSFTTDTPVFDMCDDPAGGLWIGKLPNARGTTLVRYDNRGVATGTITLKHMSNDLFDNIFALARCGANQLVVAYMTHNTVEIWETSGRFVREFHISGVRPRADRKTLRTGGLSNDIAVPENNIFQDVATDPHGRIYLLADAYAAHPRRDVYVVNPEGRMISQLLLHEPSQGISIDAHGDLFSIEGGRTLIRIYKLGDFQ